jgi:hypothetical protein
MYPPTPDAIHRIALDNRTEAMRAAAAHRRTGGTRDSTHWTALTVRLRSAFRRQAAIEPPFPSPVQPTQEA